MNKENIYINELEQNCEKLNELLTDLYKYNLMDESFQKRWMAILMEYELSHNEYYNSEV